MKMTDTESYLLQQKYVDTIINFSKLANLSLNEAFHKFYQSELYQNMIHSTVHEVLDIPEENMVNALLMEYYFV